MTSNPSTAALQRHNLPEGVNLETMLKSMPWLADWLLPPEQQNAALAAPRDFIRTPFAVTMLNTKPNAVPFIDYVTQPWVALGRLARVLMASHGGWLSHRAPAHGYILLDNFEGCMALVQQPGSAINALGPHGHTMLTFAALLGRNDLLEGLLQQGADIDGTDTLGNSALHWACIMRNRPMIASLLAHGAGPRPAQCLLRHPRRLR